MFWITKAALAHLGPGAAIINTASVNAYEPSENLLDYAATKAAIVNFSKGLAKQLAESGIRVNAVAPGPFWTPLQVCGGQPPEKLPNFGKDTPIGPARAAGRTRRHLRAARLQRGELLHRPGLRRRRRARRSLRQQMRVLADSTSRCTRRLAPDPAREGRLGGHCL